MTPFQPEYHCYHAGKWGWPDADGDRVCVPNDCIDENTPQELIDAISSYNYSFIDQANDTNVTTESHECSDEERNQIAAATLLTLPACCLNARAPGHFVITPRESMPPI